MSSYPPKPPAYEVRFGTISGRCFLNEDARRGSWYSSRIVRHYVDAKGVPRVADTFGINDLLVVAEVARRCWEWIASQTPRPDPPSPPQPETPEA